jgi:FKBP-type peptidyl-prolyl cis-trans isomerase
MHFGSISRYVGMLCIFPVLAHTPVLADTDLDDSQTPHGASVPGSADMAEAPPDVLLPSADAQKTTSGLATKVLKIGVGSDHPADNDCVSIVFRAWRRDGTLVSTSGHGDEASTQCVRPAMPGIAEALKLMVVGEKRRIWLPADLTHVAVVHHAHKQLMDSETSKMDLTFDLELVRILRAPPTPSDLRSPAKGALRMPSGVYMQILKPGVGRSHPSVTSWLTVDYTGWTSDGKLFESTALVDHPRLVPFGMTLPGWQDTLQNMVVGEMVRLWVPAALAYGDNPEDMLLPKGDLIYDLQLLAFN